jgi:hydrogenase expression/formation protein HypE
LASTLHELAQASHVGVHLDESRIPIRREVRGACEMLGLDPLYVANEGKLVAVVPREEAPAALRALRSHPLGQEAAEIGQVVAASETPVVLRSLSGGERVVQLLSGAQLPRIC